MDLMSVELNSESVLFVLGDLSCCFPIWGATCAAEEM